MKTLEERLEAAKITDRLVCKESDSTAVIAAKNGHGCVLYYGGGPYLAFEIEDAGMRDLGDLGLDDAPDGISVWEGIYVVNRTYSHDGPDDTTEPVGGFRQPNDEEWDAIRNGRSPWSEVDLHGDDGKETPVLTPVHQDCDHVWGLSPVDARTEFCMRCYAIRMEP